MIKHDQWWVVSRYTADTNHTPTETHPFVQPSHADIWHLPQQEPIWANVTCAPREKGRFDWTAGGVNVPSSSLFLFSVLSHPLVLIKGPTCSPHYGSVLLYLCRRSGKANKDNGSSLSNTNKVGGGRDNVWLKADTQQFWGNHTLTHSLHLAILPSAGTVLLVCVCSLTLARVWKYSFLWVRSNQMVVWGNCPTHEYMHALINATFPIYIVIETCEQRFNSGQHCLRAR